jgi:hypothetical protein
LGLRLLAARRKENGAGNGHNRQSQACQSGNGSGRGRQITVQAALLSGLHARLGLFCEFNMSRNIATVKDRWLCAVSKRRRPRHFAPGAATHWSENEKCVLAASTRAKQKGQARAVFGPL